MTRIRLPLVVVAACALALTLSLMPAGDALAAKPEWAGQGKKGDAKSKSWKKGDKGKSSGAPSAQGSAGGSPGRTHAVDGHGYFDHHHVGIIRDYYRSKHAGGHCPPGLAKKNNGCRPPGHAKRWKVGSPLPPDVEVVPLPRDLRHRLGGIADDYQLVRVGADILKIAVGTTLVLEALEDLGEIL